MTTPDIDLDADARIARLAKMEARATPRPWYVTGDPWFTSADGVIAGSPDGNIGFVIADCEAMGPQRDEYEGPFELAEAEDDAALIAAVRNDLPWLLEQARAVGRLEAEVSVKTTIIEQQTEDYAHSIARLEQESAELRGSLTQSVANEKTWADCATTHFRREKQERDRVVTLTRKNADLEERVIRAEATAARLADPKRTNDKPDVSKKAGIIDRSAAHVDTSDMSCAAVTADTERSDADGR